jgi:hypothetical protein
VTTVDAGPQCERRAPAGRFQFSLATALVVVTGVSVALSLVMWHSTFGLMAAIVLVGGGWAAAARRAGYRKLAYFLAASAMGVIAHLVLGGPLVLFGRPGLPRDVWFLPLPVLWMFMSATAAATLIRRLRDVPALAGVAGVYLTAMIFPESWAAFTLLSHVIPLGARQLPPPDDAFVIALLGPVGGAFLATITAPLTWPTATLFCVILRWIDPPPQVWLWTGREEWKLVDREPGPSEGRGSAPEP